MGAFSPDPERLDFQEFVKARETKRFVLVCIGPSGDDHIISTHARRTDALRARDEAIERNAKRAPVTYRVYCEDDYECEEEWDDERYCYECQDVRVKPGGMCGECLSEQAEYWSDYYREEGGSP